MVIKKDLVIAVLSTFCLTVTLFAVIPTRSSPGIGDYDPWYDINDDGQIDGKDLSVLAKAFGTYGTPINKTALLLELQSRMDDVNASLLDLKAQFLALLLELQTEVDSLNASLLELQSKIATLETTIATLETTIATLTARIAALEAPGSVTTEKIANGAVTNIKLASGAIPFGSINRVGTVSTGSAGYVDMPGVTLSLTLDRASCLLIIFSSDAYFTDPAPGYIFFVRALVNGTPVSPPEAIFARSPSGAISPTPPQYYGSYSHHFYSTVPPGAHIIKIQWRTTGPPIWATISTLTVVALPA